MRGGVCAGWELLTGAGTSTAMMLQLGLVALGMTQVFGMLGAGSSCCAGSASPISFNSASRSGGRRWPGRKSPRAMFARALLVSMTNPKTLLFYGAFFPQFVSPEHGFTPQVVLPVDGSWALAAARARHLLATRGRLRNRIDGEMLIGAGAVLAAARHR